MTLSALHLLLTYQCTLQCEHCFVWGSPWQTGTMTRDKVERILDQAQEVDTIKGIYFEGGEPFLYYATLLEGVRQAAERGFETGIVSNAYWATSVEDAELCLHPFAGLLNGLTVSSDLYHWSEVLARQARNARAAAETLGIPCSTLTVAQPDASDEDREGASAVMYRGRAAHKLAARVPQHDSDQFTVCPYENLRDPSRLHVGPLGNMHLCQGISVGNLFETPLREICDAYDPDAHPVVGPLLSGGPAALAQRYGVDHRAQMADACQLCYEVRRALRAQFPQALCPDQVYGVDEVARLDQ